MNFNRLELFQCYLLKERQMVKQYVIIKYIIVIIVKF